MRHADGVGMVEAHISQRQLFLARDSLHARQPCPDLACMQPTVMYALKSGVSPVLEMLQEAAYGPHLGKVMVEVLHGDPNSWDS